MMDQKHKQNNKKYHSTIVCFFYFLAQVSISKLFTYLAGDVGESLEAGEGGEWGEGNRTEVWVVAGGSGVRLPPLPMPPPPNAPPPTIMAVITKTCQDTLKHNQYTNHQISLTWHTSWWKWLIPLHFNHFKCIPIEVLYSSMKEHDCGLFSPIINLLHWWGL